MKRLLSLLAIAVSFYGAPVFARDSPEVFPVYVDVSASSAAEKADVYSSVERELRKLEDVRIVDSRADAVFTLEVIVNDIEANGRTIGNTVSMVMTMEIPEGWLAPAANDLFKALGSSPRLYEDALLEHDGAGNLDRICKDIVATFNTRELNSWRKIMASVHADTGR